ncbi:helix-turn-helix domain-containing protein [Longispora albida]|uniref:helix-turn-helix domain-containing protein n=1 Tax=Longispora albida TaxID=203523 RepID=UPI0012FBB987|nr:helix-turn-helix domain-containing protein [Longispora albida]
MGELFRLVRRHTGASQTRIAIAVSAAQSDVSQYMSDQRLVRDIGVLERIAAGLHMPDRLRRRFGLAPAEDSEAETPLAPDPALEELHERLSAGAAIDSELVTLLDTQTDHLRKLDRRLGAPVVHAQLREHVATVTTLWSHAVLERQRQPVAAVLADAATLAGWQSLDLGDLAEAWRFHELARAASKELWSPELLSHAMAQQAYILIDAGHRNLALELAEEARAIARPSVAPLLGAWLLGVVGEARAETGDGGGSRRAFDEAAAVLDALPETEEIPYLSLDPAHLARWRGNALVKLGDAAAVGHLNEALAEMGGEFSRARTSLLTDLAYAHHAGGRTEDARTQIGNARALASKIGSRRQVRRIDQLDGLLRSA